MTALEKLLQRCEDAYRRRCPLIFIDTDDFDIIREVIQSDRTVVRMKKEQGLLSQERFIPCCEDTTARTKPVPAYDPLNNVKTIVNLDTSGTVEWPPDANFQFPKLFVIHVPYTKDNTFDRSVLVRLMIFVDMYLMEPDDYSTLRSSLVLLYGNVAAIPNELKAYCEVVSPELPEQKELAAMLRDMIAAEGMELPPESEIRDIAYSMTGFSVAAAQNMVKAILSAPMRDGLNMIYDYSYVIDAITEQKKQILKRDGLLELIDTGNLSQIGGMRSFRDWFQPISRCFSESARIQAEVGISAPRGVLMCGIPGCGKSLAAKAAAAQMDKPLLQLDVNKLMGSHVGESEANTARALKLAEAMAPCVLWIDELDKAFDSVTGSSSSDGGVFKRMFGHLLTWMQENTKPVFIFATANDISALPKEFFRSGRFDELFAVYMPTQEELVEILDSKMRAVQKRSGRQIFDAKTCLDKECQTAIVKGFCQGNRHRFLTGADVEKLVTNALRKLCLEGSTADDGIIEAETWKRAMAAAFKDATVYGESHENLDSIAVCTLRLIRENFRSSGAASLFRREDYFVEYKDDDIEAAGFVKRLNENWPEYDRYLYEELLKRINRFAKRFEMRAQGKMMV